jgi:hypothetical protein
MILLVATTTTVAACGGKTPTKGSAAARVVTTQAGAGGGSTHGPGTADPSSAGPSGSADINTASVQLPRTVTYAGLEVSLTKVTATVGEDGSGSNVPGVQLDMTAKNNLSKEADLTTEEVSLLAADSSRAEATSLKHDQTTSSIPVVAGGKVTATAFVPVPNGTDLSGYSFSISEKDKFPASVPLSGTPPTSGYPLTVAAPGETAQVQFSNGSTVAWRVESVQIVLDDGDARADKDSRWALVKVRMQAGKYSEAISDDSMKLVVDDLPGSAANGYPDRGIFVLNANEGKEATYVYKLPAQFTKVSVLAGDPTNGPTATHDFALTVPPLPAS